MKYTLKLSDTNRQVYSNLVTAFVAAYGLTDFVILNHNGFCLSFHCDEKYLAKFVYHYVSSDFNFDESVNVDYVLNMCYDRYFIETAQNVMTRKELDKLKTMLRDTLPRCI